MENLTLSAYFEPNWIVNNNFFFYMIGMFVICFVLLLSAAMVLTRNKHNVMVIENPNTDIHSQQRILLAFKTSPIPGSGCNLNTNVSVILKGSHGRSPPYLLSRQLYPFTKFLRGNLDLFLIHFDYYIGFVEMLTIIVENRGMKKTSWRLNEMATYDPDSKYKMHFVVPGNTKIVCEKNNKVQIDYSPLDKRNGSIVTRAIEYILTNHYVISIYSPVHLRNFGRVARCIFFGFVVSFLCFGSLLTYIMLSKTTNRGVFSAYLVASQSTNILIFVLSCFLAFLLEQSRPRYEPGLLTFPDTLIKHAIMEPPSSRTVTHDLKRKPSRDSEATLADVQLEDELLREQLWHHYEPDGDMQKNKSIKRDFGYYEKRTKDELDALKVDVPDIKKGGNDAAALSKNLTSAIEERVQTDLKIQQLLIETNKLRREFKRKSAGNKASVSAKVEELLNVCHQLQNENLLEIYKKLLNNTKISYDDIANFVKNQQLLINSIEKLANIQTYSSGKLERFYEVPYFRVDPASSVRDKMRLSINYKKFNDAIKHDPKTIYRESSHGANVDIRKDLKFDSPHDVSVNTLPNTTTDNKLGIAADAIVKYSMRSTMDLQTNHNVTSIRDNLQKFCDILLKQMQDINLLKDQNIIEQYEIQQLIEYFMKCYVNNEIHAQNLGISLKAAMTDVLFFPTRNVNRPQPDKYIFEVITGITYESVKDGIKGAYEPGVSSLSSKSKPASSSDFIPSNLFSFDRRQILAHLKVNPSLRHIVCDVVYNYAAACLSNDVINFIKIICVTDQAFDMLNELSNFLAKNIQHLVSFWKELQKSDEFIINSLCILLAADILKTPPKDNSVITSAETLFKHAWVAVDKYKKSLEDEESSKKNKNVKLENIVRILCSRVIMRSVDEVFVELENPLYLFHKALGMLILFEYIKKKAKAKKNDAVISGISIAYMHFKRQGYFQSSNPGEMLSRSIMCEYLSGRLNNKLDKDIQENSPNLDKFNVLLLKRIEYYYMINVTKNYQEIVSLTGNRLIKNMDQEYRFCQHLKCRDDYICSYIIQSVDRMGEHCRDDPVEILIQILRNQLMETKNATTLQHMKSSFVQGVQIDINKDLNLIKSSPEVKQLADNLLEARENMFFLGRVAEVSNLQARKGYIEKEQPTIMDQVMISMQQVIDSRNMYVVTDETKKGLWHFRSIIIGEHKRAVNYRWRQITLSLIWIALLSFFTYTLCKGIDFTVEEAKYWTISVFIGIVEYILIFEFIRLLIKSIVEKNWRLTKPI